MAGINTAPAAVLAFLILLLSGCGDSEFNNPGETREGRPDQESWGATIILTKEGAKQAVVQAGHLEKYNERQYIALDDSVTVDFFDPDEVHTSLLISRRAEIDEKTDFMTAIGNVVVKSDSGVVLYTDTLHWNSDLELIYTDDPVMITTELQDTLYGIGFESDASLEHWKVEQPSGVTERGRDGK